MATETVRLNSKSSNAPAQSQYPPEILNPKVVLDHCKSFDVTPVINRKFVNFNWKDCCLEARTRMTWSESLPA